MLKLLKTYQKRLTNLSTNNKSLLLLRLSDKFFLDLHRLDFTNNKPSFYLIENLITKKKKITLCSNIDSRDDNNNKIANILQQIRRTDHQIQEERGAKDLYVAYPFVQGTFIDGTLIRCPLLFFPIELVLDNNEWQIKIIDNQAVRWNTTFLLAYSHYNNVSFTEEFLEQSFEDFNTDSQIFRTELYNLIEKSPLELHFNPENFTDKLQDFKEFTKKDFEEATKIGELKLMSEAVIGVFPMADSFLIPDYDTLIEKEIKKISNINNLAIQEKDNFSLFFSKNNQNNNILATQVANEANFITPYAIDASQELALQAVKNGNSIVVQGPPGTGKSQLICNLIADFLAQGKKILVVCQKRAALDVVHKRLAEKDFGKSAALVHDIQADRRQIFDLIKTHIENLEDYQKTNESFNVLYAEKRFNQLCSQIDAISADLILFRKTLYDTSLCRISVKELYLTSNKNNSKPDFPKKEQKNNIKYQNFTFDNYVELLQKIKMYLYYLEQIENNTAQNHDDNFLIFEIFWNERKTFANYSIKEKNILTNLIIEIPKNWEILQKNLVQNIGKNLDLKTINNLLIEAENIVSFVANEIGTQPSYIALWNLLQYKVTDEQLISFQKHGNKIIKALKNSETIEQNLHNDDLKIYVDYLKKYLTAQEKFFSRMKWKFAKEKRLLQKLAADNQLILTVENANVLLKKIKKRTEFEKLRTELFSFEWLVKFDLIDYSFDLQEFTNLFENYKQKTLKAKTIWEKFSKSFLDTDVFDTQAFDNFVKNIEKVITLCKNFTQTYNEWKTYFTEKQINTLITNDNVDNNFKNLEILTKILHINFDLLIELDSHRNNLSKNELELCEILANEITNQIIEENQNPSPTEPIVGNIIENIIKNFDNDFRLFWIGEIEAKNPILRSVSTSKLAHLEEELQRCLHEKNVLSIELLHQKLREKTYNNLNFNRLNNLVSYRDLKHQVNKKRYVFPLRKLLHQFGEEIFNLVPCWLASPETVSALFDKKDLFDLVIFDEASQCFAEKGLPAVFRGKQVVIAGDSKQLAPFDLYRPRWEEEFDADTELQTALEVESLLDLGANELPSYHLRGHYRSQSLDLIDFSNQLFYGNRLQMIPHYQEFVKQEPAIEYIKVDGVWEKNTNLIEAKKVVNLIKNLQAKDKTNIGVITFNAHQQSLILDLLEENNIGLSEEIFVKNIENVQGDERDIIIFSLAYAPSPSGRMSMQFGLLNLAKGENRLNVAITRAKEKIYVVASIFPHQLQTENLQNDGAKILQKYLHYALEVSEGRYKPSLPTANKQNISWYLKNMIAENKNNDENNRENMQEKNGTKSLIQLPFADITLRKSSNYHLVLTDDNLFYDALSVKEWFAYMPMQLKSKAWNFERIWSRVWWEN